MTSTPRAASPHTKPAVASAIGLVVGALTLLQGYFGSGHIPSGAEIASVVSGSGLALGSVVAFICSHLGISKAQLAHDAQVVAEEYPKLQAMVADVPGLSDRVTALERSVDQKLRDAIAALPAPVQPDVDQLAEQVKAKLLSAVAQPTAPSAASVASPAPVTPAS